MLAPGAGSGTRRPSSQFSLWLPSSVCGWELGLLHGDRPGTVVLGRGGMGCKRMQVGVAAHRDHGCVLSLVLGCWAPCPVACGHWGAQLGSWSPDSRISCPTTCALIVPGGAS